MLTNHRIVILKIALAVTVGMWARGAQAQTTQYWSSASGGDFGSAGNWNTTVPGTNDTASFNLNAGYTVTFGGSVTNTRAEIQDGNVVLDLGGNRYTLRDLNQDSLVVGNQVGLTPALTLKGGTVRIAEGATARTTDILVGVGANAEGTLILTNGAVLTMHNTASHNSPLIVGHSSGKGTMLIAGGAVTNFGRYVLVGNQGGTGLLTLSGPDSVLSYDEIFLSRLGGNGTMIIENGATVRRRVNQSYQQFSLGAGNPASVSTAIVRNAGSTLDTGILALLAPSTGYFYIEDGATVESTRCNMGGNSADSETVTELTGTDSLWTATEVYLGGQGPLITDRTGISQLTITDGGRLEASTRIVLLPRGTLRGDGTNTVTGADGLINRGGLVAPGVTNPAALGTLTVDGHYTQEIAVDGANTFVGTLHVRIGTSQSDKLSVTGNLTLDGALDLTAFGSPSLDYGNTFDILDWGGTLSGAFSATNAFEPAPGLWWDYSNLYSNGTITVTGPPRGTMISVQ